MVEAGAQPTSTLHAASARVCGDEVHDALIRTRVLGLIISLRSQVGDEFMTGVTGADALTMNDWCEGWVAIPRDMEDRLRIIDTLFATFDDHGLSQADTLAWFATSNVALGGETPAHALRHRRPTDVAPALLVAARASIG